MLFLRALFALTLMIPSTFSAEDGTPEDNFMGLPRGVPIIRICLNPNCTDPTCPNKRRAEDLRQQDPVISAVLAALGMRGTTAVPTEEFFARERNLASQAPKKEENKES